MPHVDRSAMKSARRGEMLCVLTTPTKSAEPNVQLYLLDIQTTSCKHPKRPMPSQWKNLSHFTAAARELLSQTCVRPQPTMIRLDKAQLIFLLFRSFHGLSHFAPYKRVRYGKWIFKRNFFFFFCWAQKQKLSIVDCCISLEKPLNYFFSLAPLLVRWNWGRRRQRCRKKKEVKKITTHIPAHRYTRRERKILVCIQKKV